MVAEQDLDRFRAASVVLRRLQTLDELDRLDRELADWCTWRRDTDAGTTDSQLSAVEKELCAASAAVRNAAPAANLTGSTGDLYERWARVDAQIIALRRVWHFFRSRFDQRDDPALKQIVQAASEVTWSCFKPFFEQTGAQRPPAPLACIEFDYAPSTLLRHHAQALGRLPDSSDLLQRYFKTLPVPLLRLPPTVISAPWLLGIIAHEVGHTLYPCLHEDGSFPSWFAQQVRQVAMRGGANDTALDAWQRWAPEIFADLYSVLMMGPAAIWLIRHYELAGTAKMSAARTAYPPAAVRLFLVEEAWRQLVGAPAAGEGQHATTDYRVAGEIAKLVRLEIAAQQRPLYELVDFRGKQYQTGLAEPQELEQWSLALRGLGKKADDNSLRTARLVAAGAVDATAALAETDLVTGSKTLDQLRAATPVRIVNCRETGKRNASGRESARETDLATLLLQASDDELLSADDAD